MKKIKVGDKVMWCGSFGHDVAKEVTIKSIEHCANGGKYGESVKSISEDIKDECVFDLSNGKWCYGNQISLITDKPQLTDSELITKINSLKKGESLYFNPNVEGYFKFHATVIEMCGSSYIVLCAPNITRTPSLVNYHSVTIDELKEFISEIEDVCVTAFDSYTIENF